MAEDDDWKFAVEDFDDPDESDATDAGRATDVFVEASVRRDIEPQSPSFENALFVVLGVALALAILLVV